MVRRLFVSGPTAKKSQRNVHESTIAIVDHYIHILASTFPETTNVYSYNLTSPFKKTAECSRIYTQSGNVDG